MCGLAGFVTLGGFAEAETAGQILETMTGAIAHRGPDAAGYWLDNAEGIALGHRRLSILDLSSAGAQPMHSACGRYVVAFNGEIYNHLELRCEFEGKGKAPQWNGHSDTETLLAAISEWGLHHALQKTCGMFTLALWDRQKHLLSLARDRMGEKPLYLARNEEGWMFGSELRALIAGGLSKRVEPAALAAYLRLGHVPDHCCILEGVQKVMPGSIINLPAGAEPQQVRFDSVEAQFGQEPTITDPDKALLALENVMEEVVDNQMLSDVPLGCFLSGGIDSSLVASLMQASSNRQIHSFSIGFKDRRFNEAPHAAAVAAHLGTAHTEFTVHEEDALAIVPDLSNIYDEPFADSSQVPTTLLCRAAREHVTVALTGDGGDEVFGGYNRHIRGPGLFSRLARVPEIVRPMTAGAVQSVAWLTNRNERLSQRVIEALGLPLTTLGKLPKLASALRGASDAEAFYQTFISTGPRPETVLASPQIVPSVDPRARDPAGLDMAEWIMARDTTGYLPGDILVKVDRAAMSVGLETRAPFLDARVSRVARQIPLDLHVDGRTGKKLLRELLYRHVPRTLIERPKQGFAMPVDEWLRGSLQTWGATLIADDALAAALGLNAAAINTLWAQHQAQHVNAGTQLWTVLMLFLWAKEVGLDCSDAV